MSEWSRVLRALGLFLLPGLLLGCMTIQTRTDPGYTGARIYSGARTDLANMGEAGMSLNLGLIVIALVDLPFSFLADTVLLPLTIPEERERRAALEVEATPIDEQAESPVSGREGTPPLEMGKRLYRECLKRIEKLQPSFIDCYSVDAIVSVVTPGPDGRVEMRVISGAQYKVYLRDRIARARSDGDYVTFREASFELEGERVRVRTSRVAASTSMRHQITLLLGAGDDGGWRILEERSAGWPVDR